MIQRSIGMCYASATFIAYCVMFLSDTRVMHGSYELYEIMQYLFYSQEDISSIFNYSIGVSEDEKEDDSEEEM